MNELELRVLREEVGRLRGLVERAADDLLAERPAREVARYMRREIGVDRGRRWSTEEIVGKFHEWAALYGSAPAQSAWTPAQLRDRGQGEALRRFVEGDWPSAMTVHRRFGSWGAALQAARLEPVPLGRPVGVVAAGIDPRLPEWTGWELVEGLRKRRGLSRAKLSAEAHVSTTHIYALEMGKYRNPTVRVLIGLAHALSTRASVLLDE
jgi:DNA-binding XRE family transcriptional regulator